MNISIKEIELIVNNLPKQKALGTDGFTGEFYPPPKEKMTSILYNLFQKINTEGPLFNSFYDASITLILNPEKDIARET